MKTLDVNAELVKEMYKRGLSLEDVASQLGVSGWVVSDRLKRQGVALRDRTWKLAGFRRKYTQNDNALDLLTPKVAWILGWMLSDGYVHPDLRKFGIQVAEKDEDILHKLKEFFSFDGPIFRYKTYLKVTGKTYRGCGIRIHSERLIQKLLSHGVRPSKSQNETISLEIENASEEIQRCFVRGVFEGDGTLGHNTGSGRPQLVFQIVGTLELLSSIQQILIRHIGLPTTSITKYKASKNHYALRYVGNIQARRIFDWMYASAEFYLNRKHELYRKEIDT